MTKDRLWEALADLNPARDSDLDAVVSKDEWSDTFQRIVAHEAKVHRRSRPQRLRRGRAVIVAVALAAVAIALVVPSLSSDPRRGALAIEQQGNFLYLQVEDATADPEAMTHDLRAAGLDGNVELIPVSSTLVGKWVMVNDNAGIGDYDPRLEDLIDQVVTGNPAGARVLRVPVDFSTPLTLHAGRPATRGEVWELSSARDTPDETRPGGIVHCLQLMEPPDADQILKELGYEIEWRTEHFGADESGILSGAPSGKVIVYAELHGPNILGVSTANPDSKVASHSIEVREREAAEEHC